MTRTVVDTRAMNWEPGPKPNVWRKCLDVTAGDPCRATLLVRYDARSRIPEHDHPNGEEILVLQGTLADEHGEYPAGSYLLHPPGFRHAPYSRRRCEAFVKLHEYSGGRREHVVLNTRHAVWHPGPVPGVDVLELYRSSAHPETMALLHIAGGAILSRHDCKGGAEIFVIEGDLRDDRGCHGPGTWIRLPDGDTCALRSKKGCTLYVKRGHLAGS